MSIDFSRPILITGFGPFLEVADNPTAAIARAVDGRTVAGHPVVGRVLPVTYAGGPPQVVALARALDPVLIVGLGVARSRARVSVERVGRRALGPAPDAEGSCPADLGAGPEVVAATLDPVALARALGADLSDDAGGYVCNAWAWVVPQRCAAPAAFVHVPPCGLDPELLLAGLAALLSDPQGSSTAPSGRAASDPPRSSSPK